MTRRAIAPKENPKLPKYVRTKCAKGHVYYYFAMSDSGDGKPELRRLPDISLPHFEWECRLLLAERMGRRAPERASFKSHVYFIGGADGPIKIGLARCPHKRLKDLQVGCPVRLQIFATAQGGRRLELSYHGMFAACRLHGEWFERTPELLAEIARLASLEEAKVAA